MDNPRSPSYSTPAVRRQRLALVLIDQQSDAHQAIIFCDGLGDLTPLIDCRRPRVREQLLDDIHDRVRADVDGPRKIRDGVVYDRLAEMAPALHRVPSEEAGRQNAVAGAHGNGVGGVVEVGYGLRLWLVVTWMG